jgi:uncharacterized membrane protein YoaK (UPF0700 family)
MASDIRPPDLWLSFGLAFVGGYCDAAGFVLARAFTGHVTGNLVLAAIAVAAHDWRTLVGRLSAIFAFLIGSLLGVLIERPLKARPSWPLLRTIMGLEVILIVAASLALTSNTAHGAEIFLVFVSLALGLQNGAFCRAGGISVHTTYLTGMITSLVSTEAEEYDSDAGPPPVRGRYPKNDLLFGIAITFVLGAWVGAALTLYFKGIGMVGAVLLLIILILRNQSFTSVTSAV